MSNVPATVNLETFEALQSFQEEGEPDFITELIDAYLEDAPKRIDALKEAIQSNDSALVAKAAHGLKGASGNLGAENLAALLLEIEIAGKSGKLNSVPDLFQKVMAEYAQVKAIFLTYRK